MTTAQLASAQLHQVVASMSRASDQVLLEQLGIGLSQYKILTSIHAHPHIRQKTIAKTLGQTEASISRQVKLLQDQNLLVANRNPDNLREHLTDLTPRGMRLIEAAEMVLAHFHEQLFASLNSKQQRQLTDLLTLLQA